MKSQTSSHTTCTSENELIVRYSSLSKLLRVTALCMRFISNVRNIKIKVTRFLTTAELDKALLYWIRYSQSLFFTKELDILQKGQALPKNSSLLDLRPFLDDEGLLRVGGRIQNAILNFGEKHRFILAKTGYLSRLLVHDAHMRTLHGVVQLTRSHLVRKFWVIQNRVLVKDVIRQCVVCCRYSNRTMSQVMSNLPSERVTLVRPFLSTGVDYAGPIMMRTTSERGHKAYKGYLCIFICLATKTNHLEAVSNLTSQAFLAAFKRFILRRGACQMLMSDNGTNFQGADKELRSMFRAASSFYKDSAASLAADGTDCAFIPSHAPHFGGIWEAGVKSVKHHLRRILGDTKLTFEEMSTVLYQVEACLSNDPLDLMPLTPGHFLVGHALTTIPEPGLPNFELRPTSRWKLITQLRDHFWQRWSREYLHVLQQRPK